MTLIVPRLVDMESPRTKAHLQQFLKELLDMAYRISFLPSGGTISGGLRTYNIDAVWIAYVSNGTADTEDTVAHNLGRTPVGIWAGLPDKSSVIYDSGTAWTATNVYLKASAATTTVNLLAF